MNFGMTHIQAIVDGNEVEYLGTCWDTGPEATLRRKKSKEKGKKGRSVLY